MPIGGGLIPTGPGNGDAWISAGPGYEAQHIEALTPAEDTELEAILRPVITDAWLLQLGVPSWPDSTSNLTAEHLTSNLASRGVHFAVLVANDEVASGDSSPHMADQIISIGGLSSRFEPGPAIRMALVTIHQKARTRGRTLAFTRAIAVTKPRWRKTDLAGPL